MDAQRIPRWLFLLGSSTLFTGLIAASSFGWFRRLSLILMLASSAAMVLIVRQRSTEISRLGGAGYERPRMRGTRIIHAMANLLYSAGIMVVVFALLVRVGLIHVAIAPGLAQVFPVFTGAYVFLVGSAAIIQIRRGASPAKAWVLRAHDAFLLFVLGFVGLLLLALLFDPVIRIAGVTILTAADMPVLALFAALGIGTHLLLFTGIPTALDLLLQAFDRTQEVKGQTPPIFYAGILSLMLAAVVLFIASQFHLLDALGRFQDDRAVYIVAFVPLAMLAFFTYSIIAIWREGRRGLYRTKLSPNLRTDLIVYVSSGLLGLTGFVMLIMALNGQIGGIEGFSTGTDLAKDLTAFTIIVTMGPIGVYIHRKHRAVDNLETRLPDLLNDLAESRRAGLTLASAMQAAAKTDYGSLTPEVQKMAAQVGWGVPFTDVLAQFASRVKTNLVRRTTQLVIESSRTGGSITQVLKAAARDAYELKALESERRLSMSTYLIVLYVVFMVFIVVLAALDTQFIPAVIDAQEKVADGGLEGAIGAGGATLDQDGVRFVYFNAAMVQALGNGIVGGVLAEGRLTAGFRHAAIMAAASWFTFRLLLGIL